MNFYSVKPNLQKIAHDNKQDEASIQISTEQKENVHVNQKNSDSLLMNFDESEHEQKSK